MKRRDFPPWQRGGQSKRRRGGKEVCGGDSAGRVGSGFFSHHAHHLHDFLHKIIHGIVTARFLSAYLSQCG